MGKSENVQEVLLSKVKLSDGETLWLESGKTYKGTLYLVNCSDVKIAGKGPYPAVLEAGDGNGIIIKNCRNIQISGLDVRGSGWRKNKVSGMRVTGTENICVCGVEVSGFREGMVYQEGCKDVEITGCFVHDCGVVGIGTGGETINKNVHIAHCRVYDCAGDPLFYKNHSGSGIVLGRTHDALIEYCEAAGNGWAQRQRYANGPIGMWCWGRCERIVFRYCISRDNRTQPGAVDGGGFDFDGSVSDCFMEYDYSYHNEGAGYLLCEYGSGERWDNNIVRHCVSIDDACRVQQYGAVHYCGHVGRKIDRGIVEKSLLVPAAGHFAVSNDFMAEESKENAVNSCVMVTDSVKAIESDNPVVAFKDNEQWMDPLMYTDLMENAPRLFDPRLLHELPVFGLLENNKCADILKAEGAKALFGTFAKEKDEIVEKQLLVLELGGKDLEGSIYEGDVKLSYDSIGPCTSAKFTGESFLDFPVSWDEEGTDYIVRAYARLQSPSTRAYLYMTDDSGKERHAYLGGDCAGYHMTEIAFTGIGDVGRRIGIRVEEGCLLVQKVEIVENTRPQKSDETDSMMNIEQWRYFGDVERAKDGSFILHNASAMYRKIRTGHSVVLRGVFKGNGNVQIGQTMIKLDEDHKTMVDLPIEITEDSVELCISRLGEASGELIVEDMRLETL